jgi:hypothetical protein
MPGKSRLRSNGPRAVARRLALPLGAALTLGCLCPSAPAASSGPSRDKTERHGRSFARPSPRSLSLYSLVPAHHESVYPGQPAATRSGGFVIPAIVGRRVVLVRGTASGVLRRRYLRAPGIPEHPALGPATVITRDEATWFAVDDEKTTTSSLVRVGRGGAVTVARLPRRASIFYLAAGSGRRVTFLDIYFVGHSPEWLGSAGLDGANAFEQAVNTTGVGMVQSFAYNNDRDWYFSSNDGPGEIHAYDLRTGQVSTYQVGVQQKLSGVTSGPDGSLWIVAQDAAISQAVHWRLSGQVATISFLPTDDLSNLLAVAGDNVASVEFDSGLSSGSLVRVGPLLQIQRCPLPPDLGLSAVAEAADGTSWIVVSKGRTRNYNAILRVGASWCG